jgi:hypothetical protein
MAGSQTWFAYVKAESLNEMPIMAKYEGSTNVPHRLWVNSAGVAYFQLSGLATNNYAPADVKIEIGKWYFICGVYNGSTISTWINGIKKSFTATGTAGDSNSNFCIGAVNTGGSDAPADFFDGLIQNAGVLSVALTDSQVKKLFAATMYRGQKIRRATTNALLTQALPEDLVERLRGKEVSVVAKAYQEVASTAQVSIDDGTETASAAVATTGSWLNLGATKTISATATAITLKLKHSTSDGNTWFKEVAFYEGSSLLYIWYPSYDDAKRFSKAMRMEFADLNKGYRVEGDLAFFAGALTTNELTKDGDMGYDTANNRLYVREQGVMKYVAMT